MLRSLAGAVALLLAAGTPAAAPVEEILVGGSGGATLSLGAVVDAFHKAHPQIRVKLQPNLGTRGGIRAAAQGAVALGAASRELNAEEQALGLTAVEFARTPFVFATNARHKVTEVTLAQVADMYAGRITAWPDGSRVRVVLRPAGDADTILLRTLSEDLRQASIAAESAPGGVISITGLDNIESIASIPGAIGTTTLAQIMVEGRPLRALRLDGVEPSVKNASAGAYRPHKRFFLVMRRQPDAAARKFVAFTQSSAARAILERSGHWIAAGGQRL